MILDILCKFICRLRHGIPSSKSALANLDENQPGSSSQRSQLLHPQKTRSEEGVAEVQKKLQSIDYIDRTPSPVEKVDTT